MPIKIKIGSEEKKAGENSRKVSLQIRKSLDGSLLISDHEELDIVIMPAAGKIVLFATDQKNSDKNYSAMDRLFKYLAKRGVIDRESVHSGHVYGCMESVIQKSDKYNSIDLLLLVLSKWMDEERPNFLYSRAMEEERNEELTEPSDEESTNLGEVPGRNLKGSKSRTQLATVQGVTWEE